MFALWPGDWLNFSTFKPATFGYGGQRAASKAGHIANTNVGSKRPNGTTLWTMKRTERKKRPDEIEIDIEDVEIIMGDEFIKLHLCLETTFCGECTPHNTTIENYKIYLDKLDDLVFVGQCIKCKGTVVRVVETGETKDKAEIARHIKMIKKEYRTTKKI